MKHSEKMELLKEIKKSSEKINLSLEHAMDITAILLKATEEELVEIIKARIQHSDMIASGLLVNKHGWEISRLQELLCEVRREQSLLN